MVRRFSAKARRYMLVYLHQKLSSLDGNMNIDKKYEMNKKLVKAYKSHRDACCFDGKFINNVIKESIGVE